METTHHIVTQFDKELKEIEALLLDMARQVAGQITDSAAALASGDDKEATIVAERDSEINAMERRIDEKAIRLIALRQPMAEDLRSAIATLKISANLERMGDYAKTMSYRTSVMGKSYSTLDPILRRISRMAEKLVGMLDAAMAAYIARDLEAAVAISLEDQFINERADSLLRELLTYMMENPRNIELCTHLLFIAKNMERTGDQITNICEQIQYLVTGEMIND
ncbi:MAG: phosphate signaling complex protein PhoU [Candidatus Halichondribacter symbioticus]